MTQGQIVGCFLIREVTLKDFRLLLEKYIEDLKRQSVTSEKSI